MTFVKRNIACYLTASLFDTAVKMICAWKMRQPTRCQMADRWVPKFGTHFFFPVVYWENLSKTRYNQIAILYSRPLFEHKIHSKVDWLCNHLWFCLVRWPYLITVCQILWILWGKISFLLNKQKKKDKERKNGMQWAMNSSSVQKFCNVCKACMQSIICTKSSINMYQEFLSSKVEDWTRDGLSIVILAIL